VRQATPRPDSCRRSVDGAGCGGPVRKGCFGSLAAVVDAGGAGTPAGHREVLAGRYRLVRRLAEGGMATVWEGRDELLARSVAIKIPHTLLAADPASRERFRREAVAAARLAHPGIVATYDTGVDGPTDFIVMELVPGRTLRDLVAEGPVPADIAVPLAAQVAEALDAAHAAGLIHRDIKPANLLLVEVGPVRRVKVADFGVARAQEVLEERLSGASVTREGVVVGTARYLAPEQVAAQALDGRTDLYALGCVLHEMLAGAPPFVRDTDLAIALAHLTEEPPALRALGAAVSPALEALVLTCLAKDPAGRPASARLLGEQLRALSAPPVGPPTSAVAAIDLLGGAAGPAAGAVERPAVTTVFPAAARPGPAPATAAFPAAAPGPAAPVAAPAGRGRGDRPAPQGRAAAPARAGTKVVRRPTRSRTPLVVVGGLVVAALATALAVVVLPSPSLPPARTDGRRGTVAAGAPAITGVRSFDPAPGDGRENDDQLGRLTDGDPVTTWSSDRYRQPPVFGNLKKGVGIVLALQKPVKIGAMRVRSPSSAWSAQVYVASGPAAALSDWGEPAARAAGIEGDVEVDLDGKSGGAVLLWFTDPGRTGQVVVSEIELEAP